MGSICRIDDVYTLETNGTKEVNYFTEHVSSTSTCDDDLSTGSAASKELDVLSASKKLLRELLGGEHPKGIEQSQVEKEKRTQGKTNLMEQFADKLGGGSVGTIAY